MPNSDQAEFLGGAPLVTLSDDPYCFFTCLVSTKCYLLLTRPEDKGNAGERPERRGGRMMGGAEAFRGSAFAINLPLFKDPKR